MPISTKNVLSLFLIIVYTLCATQIRAEDKRKFLIDPKTTEISGINISSTEKDIIKILGLPKSVKENFGEFVEQPSKEYIYDGITILLIDSLIHGLSCKSNKCRTNLGVKIGDTKKKVNNIYGQGNPPYSSSTRDSLSYPLKGMDCYLIFVFANEKVHEIKFFVDFT